MVVSGGAANNDVARHTAARDKREIILILRKMQNPHRDWCGFRMGNASTDFTLARRPLPQIHAKPQGKQLSKRKSVSYRLQTFFYFFQAEDGIRDYKVTGVQTCALPI